MLSRDQKDHDRLRLNGHEGAVGNDQSPGFQGLTLNNRYSALLNPWELGHEFKPCLLCIALVWYSGMRPTNKSLQPINME